MQPQQPRTHVCPKCGRTAISQGLCYLHLRDLKNRFAFDFRKRKALRAAAAREGKAS
jgi:hypothetical protein